MPTRNVFISLVLACCLFAYPPLPAQAYAQEVDVAAEDSASGTQEFSETSDVTMHAAEASEATVQAAEASEVTTQSVVKEAATFETLKDCLVEFASATDDMTIQVSASFDITSLLEIPANSNGKTLTITSISNNSVQTLTRYEDYQNNLFELKDGAKVIFTHIVLNGNKHNIDETEANGSLVFVNEGAELTIEEGAEFRDNRASGTAGAINCKGSLVMHGGTIAGNEVERAKDTYGGGIFIMGKNASLYFDGGMVGGYTEECANEALSGGGICIIGEDNDTRQNAYVITGEAQIIGNRAGWDYVESEHYPKVFGKGGGVFHQSGTLLMSGGTIARNSALGPTSTGGGVENYYGRFVMTGGVIGGNSIEDANIAGKGGGICSEATHLDALELGGSARIAFNIAGREINGQWNEGIGGGVLLGGMPSSGVLSSCTIENNEARGQDNLGSGIYVLEEFTLFLKGAPLLRNNALYTEDPLAESLVLQENLTGGSLVIQGSNEDGQMLEGVVAASSSGFTVNNTTAQAFISEDKRLVGIAQGNTVVWALAPPPPRPLPPTGDGTAGVLLASLLVVTAAALLLAQTVRRRHSR